MSDINTISVNGSTTDINKINLNGTEYNLGSQSIQLYKYPFKFNIPKKTNSSIILTLPTGAYPIGCGPCASGGDYYARPPATRVEISGISGNKVTMTYSNPFEFSYTGSGDIYYTLVPWNTI